MLSKATDALVASYPWANVELTSKFGLFLSSLRMRLEERKITAGVYQVERCFAQFPQAR